MRSKVYTVELLVDNLLSGRISLGDTTGAYDVKSDRDNLNLWIKLRTTQPDSKQFSDLTEVFYLWLLHNRMTGTITGIFDEQELEQQVASLTKELNQVKQERDACLSKLAEMGQNPPVHADFKANQ